jgi:hypothetical protein
VAAGLVGAVTLCGFGLSGCVSTQRKNARAKLVAARTLGGRELPRAIERGADVRVLRVALVRGRSAGGALVVALRNRGAQPVTDVPIAVGVRARDGRRTRLNARRGLDWFQTHVPAIGPGETTTWIFTTRQAVPAGRPWAVAGIARGALATRATGALPQVEAQPAGRRRGGAVRVALDNRSAIPQYGLQVYAVVRDGRRLVAAGKATVSHLATHAHGSARVPLFGAARGRTVWVHALPTIFE